MRECPKPESPKCPNQSIKHDFIFAHSTILFCESPNPSRLAHCPVARTTPARRPPARRPPARCVGAIGDRPTPSTSDSQAQKLLQR
jgi:hypothetical protein